MKTTKYLIMAVILSISFTGCNNDDDPKPPGPGNEGDITVQLHLSDEGPATYAATGTEDATPEESKLDNKLEVFIFDEHGKLEFSRQLNIPASPGNLTDKFQITTGRKLIYVFSNLTAGNIPAPQPGSDRVDFEKNIRQATIDAFNTSISKDNEFFIGTLWADSAEVIGTGTTDNPEKIKLEIGRLAAKINLIDVNENAGGNLKGKFEDQFYRIRSIPSKFYLVGQHDGGFTNIPPSPGVQVTSAVHSIQDTVSANYSSYSFPATTNINKPFYTTENTSAANENDGGNVYFGSITHIQLRTKYVPDGSEIYNGSTGNPDPGSLPSDGTFYTGILNGSLLIFNSDPTLLNGISNVKLYNEGLNYYNLPIKDINESNISLQTSIIRNHYYIVSVTRISRLGENTEELDPQTPITEDKDIQLELEILKWAKVVYEIDI